MAYEAGQIVGETYRVVRRLGAGGMGAVYEVEHVKLGVRYALKAFTFAGANDALLRNRFLAEGRILARLHNPHLVHVFDLDVDARTGTPYFVMDLVLCEGDRACTLADVDTDGLDEACAVQWFRELAEALDYIHAQGVVHRDLKMANVLLDAGRHVVLSDFGVSHFSSNELRQELDAMQTLALDAATQTRLVMGTRGYMAPEVVRGEAVTPAADSYSLGVLFLYLLTGMWYSRGSKALKLLDTYDYNWQDVLPPLLEEDPARRATDLVGLASRLRPSAAEPPATGPVQTERAAPRRRPARGMRVAALVLAALVLAALTACLLFRTSADDPFDSFSSRDFYEKR